METNFGNKIVTLRKEKNITQSQLADFVGVTKASVSKWETGQTLPDISLLPLLAAFFNQTIDDLLGYEFQLSRKEIENLYSNFKQQILESPKESLIQLRQLIKRYWSCYPLVMSMSSLLLNHATELATYITPEDLNEECYAYLSHVYSNSKDEDTRLQAKSLLAIILLSQNKTNELLEFLGDKAAIVLPAEPIIATALVKEKRTDDAKQVLQVSIYQYVLVLLNLLSSYLSIPTLSKIQIQTTIQMMDGMLKTFSIASFHPVIELTARFPMILSYITIEENELALDELEKYISTLNHTTFPVSLHGNDYFDKVDSWIAHLPIGNQIPRNTQFLEEEFINIIICNPLLTSLHDISRYQQLIKHLKKEA